MDLVRLLSPVVYLHSGSQFVSLQVQIGGFVRFRVFDETTLLIVPKHTSGWGTLLSRGTLYRHIHYSVAVFIKVWAQCEIEAFVSIPFELEAGLLLDVPVHVGEGL